MIAKRDERKRSFRDISKFKIILISFSFKVNVRLKIRGRFRRRIRIAITWFVCFLMLSLFDALGK